MAPKQGFADLPEGGRLLNSLDMLSMTSQLNALLRGLLIIHLLSFCSSCADSRVSQKQNAPREVAALTPQQNAHGASAALPPPDGWEPYPNPAPDSAEL
jgi:hypothetical protein